MIATIHRAQEDLSARVHDATVVRREIDGRFPDETVRLHRRLPFAGGLPSRCDADAIAELLVQPEVLAVFPRGVHPAAIGGIRHHIDAVAAAQCNPVVDGYPSGGNDRGAFPVFVILEARVDVIRLLHVHEDLVNLFDGDVVVGVTRQAAIIRHGNPAVAPHDHAIPVLLVDPERAHITKHLRERFWRIPGLAAIHRMMKSVLCDVEVLVVAGIHKYLTKVVGAFCTHVEATAYVRPREPSVRGAVHLAAFGAGDPGITGTAGTTAATGAPCAPSAPCGGSGGSGSSALLVLWVLILDDGVEDIGIRLVHVESDSADSASGQAGHEPRPVLAGIGGFVDATFRAAIDHLPGEALLVIRGRIEDTGVARIHQQVDDADLLADKQDPVPALPAIERPEHAAFGVVGEEASHGCDIHDVRLRGMHHDFCDVVRFLEPHVRPVLPRIDRLVHAVAAEGTARRERVAGTDPYNVRIRRRYRDRADT